VHHRLLRLVRLDRAVLPQHLVNHRCITDGDNLELIKVDVFLGGALDVFTCDGADLGWVRYPVVVLQPEDFLRKQILQ
jgi:hypothetical protein